MLYFNARYYDPELGQFLSPDTIVPDPSNLFDYNRYMFVRGNPMKYNDPTGRSSCLAIPPANPFFAMAKTICQAGEMAMQYGPTAVQLAVQWADKLPAVDWLFSNTAEQGANSAGQQNAGNSASGDPNDPFRNVSEAIRRGVDTLRSQINNLNNYTTGRYGAQAHLSRAEHYQRQGILQSVNATGRGSIDLILNNNTGVEVKYWSANHLSQNLDSLARQLRGFSPLNLNQITVEFVQTQNNPVTSSMLADLRTQLINRGVNMANTALTIVANPGIP